MINDIVQDELKKAKKINLLSTIEAPISIKHECSENTYRLPLQAINGGSIND